jgi:excinuclease ABC subunit C
VSHYGRRSAGQLRESVRLNLELGLRGALDMPVVYAEQGDLFSAPRRAACLRYELGSCLGPCGGFVTQAAYEDRVGQALAFLEGRGIAPLDRVVDAMTRASDEAAFESAARLRDRFEALEWLFAAGSRIRAAIDALSFVYADPGTFGDDRVYVIRRATVRASAPAPHTPIEQFPVPGRGTRRPERRATRCLRTRSTDGAAAGGSGDTRRRSPAASLEWLAVEA